MKVITLNVNGIRSAAKKGMFDWLKKQKSDVICLQEVRASESQLTDPIYKLEDYYYYHVEAEKKGYSGVAIYCKQKPIKVVSKLGFPLADSEGRYCHIEYDNLIIVSIYFPSGTSGDARQDLKYEFMDWYLKFIKKQRKSGKSIIICGDVNIAHTKMDIKNWRGNQKNSGFLPEERAWLDDLFGKYEFVDAFRVLNKEPDQYTWWSNRGRAWDNNVGWRIDYQIVTKDLENKIKKVEIYKQERFSDHSPLIIDYTVSI